MCIILYTLAAHVANLLLVTGNHTSTKSESFILESKTTQQTHLRELRLHHSVSRDMCARMIWLLGIYAKHGTAKINRPKDKQRDNHHQSWRLPVYVHIISIAQYLSAANLSFSNMTLSIDSGRDFPPDCPLLEYSLFPYSFPPSDFMESVILVIFILSKAWKFVTDSCVCALYLHNLHNNHCTIIRITLHTNFYT